MLKVKTLKSESSSFWDLFSAEMWGEGGDLTGVGVSGGRKRGCVLEKEGEIATNA